MAERTYGWGGAVGNYEFDYDLNQIRKYVALLSGFIADQHRELTEEAEARYDGEVNELGEPIEHLTGERYEMKQFDRMLCNSALTNICTYAETELVSLAYEDFMRREKPTHPIRSERREQASATIREVDHAKAYWKRHGLKHLETVAWFEYSRIVKVRHVIMHANSVLDDGKRSEDIQAYIEQRFKKDIKSLGIVGRTIVVEPAYLDEACTTIRTLLIEIASAIP